MIRMSVSDTSLDFSHNCKSKRQSLFKLSCHRMSYIQTSVSVCDESALVHEKFEFREHWKIFVTAVFPFVGGFVGEYERP